MIKTILPRTGPKISIRWCLVLMVTMLIVLAANAHLAYVAVTTQPACILHVKDKGTVPGEYRAAKSDC